MPREKRAETERTERRKQRGANVVDGRKLVVSENELDRDRFEYRFAADRPGRVQALHDNDWDVVERDKNPLGGVDKEGKPYGMVLMRKRKDWFEEDQKEKQKPAQEIEDAIRRNQAGNVAAQTDRDLAEHAYVPGSGNRMDVSSGYKP